VALKTIRLDTHLAPKRREELIARLLDEAVMVARLNHHNVVSVYDVEDGDEEAFVAMEFVDGRSLEGVLFREGRLDPGRVVLLGASIARGLAAAHEHGLVHRDIKPANILLGREGSIKVTDFGISELISDMTGEEDVVFGTPGYLPPETLQGHGYRTTGDLFSLGAVLYVCLTGRRPFDGRSVQEIIRHTLSGKVTPVSELVPSERLPRELDELILELLHPDPEQRPNDAAAVAQRLEELGARLGLSWRPPDALAQNESGDDDLDIDGASAAFVSTTGLARETTERVPSPRG
jgi:serine/threonine protein kinase